MGMVEMVQAAEVFVRSIAGYETTVFAYGRRALTMQTNQAPAANKRAGRVVICPPKGRPGVYEAARGPGQVAGNADGTGPGRPLARLQFPFEVHCWARVSTHAATSPAAELEDDMGALALAGVVYAAIRSGAEGGYGAAAFKAGGFTTDPTELRYGSEFTFDWMIPIRIEDVTTPARTVEFEFSPRFGLGAVDGDDATSTVEEPPIAVPAA